MIVILLVLAAIVAGLVGLNASNMIQTIGYVGIGCLFGVLARIVQANVHHKELLDILDRSMTASERADAAARVLSPK